jgi:hypothetical protein
MTLQELFRSLKERFSRDAGVPSPPEPQEPQEHPHHPEPHRFPPNPRHAPLPPDHSSFRLGSAVAAHDSARLSLDAAGDVEATPSTPSTGGGTAEVEPAVEPAGDERGAGPPPPQAV